MDEFYNNDNYTLKLDEITGKQLSIYLYSNVQNIEEIHTKIMNKELPCCIIKANLIVDPFQIVIAANKAALNEKYGQLITKSLFTEVIFCLSNSKNIVLSLKTFGISTDTTNVLVVIISEYNEKEALEKLVFDSVKGERLPVSKLSQFSDSQLIKKTYAIGDEELKVSSLLDSVVSRISDKIIK